MIRFKELHSAYELRLLHTRLYGILAWIVDEQVWERATGQADLVITEVWRSRSETIRIYEAAGLPPPVASVHEETKKLGDPWSGCRGLDLSVRAPSEDPYDRWPLLDLDRVRAFVDDVNRSWRYQPSEAHQVALLHEVAGIHVHLQVHRDNVTERRVNPT